MSERKVLNKYFPPNFDPSLIKRRKMGKDRQQVVRLMAPFSMRCTQCGEYIYKGKKFNARKETVDGEEYYGIKIFRFYIKCTQCSAEITFKTDPKNTDYTAEHGAARNFEPWRDTDPEATEVDKIALLAEAENEDPMAALESKAIDSKREMDILDGLQELKTRNARLERAGKEAPDKFLERVSTVEVGDGGIRKKLDEFELRRKREEELDEEEVRKVFGRAYVEGVPDIELGAEGSSEEDDEEVTTPRDDEDLDGGASSSSTPVASSSKIVAAPLKRKLDAVEPTPASLLSEAQRSIVTKSFGTPGGSMAPPPKKKGKGNSALASKLGIKLTKK